MESLVPHLSFGFATCFASARLGLALQTRLRDGGRKCAHPEPPAEAAPAGVRALRENKPKIIFLVNF